MRKKTPFKRVIQILPVLSRKDAIGEEVLFIDTLLKERGIQRDILTLQADLSQTLSDDEDTLILYHYSIGCRIPYFLMECSAPLALRFHNITPSHFFSDTPEDEGTVNGCQLGFQQMSMLVRRSSHFLPVSEYNASLLKNTGVEEYRTLPILRDFSRFTNKNSPPSQKTQFLFVGRFSPNKCQHDLLQILDLYKRFVNPQARLVLVGGAFSSHYANSLIELAKKLQFRISFDKNAEDFDLLIASGVDEEELVKFYHQSSLFLCMSEHEGFCVPLVEAMHANLPILAHNSTAIPETLGEGGILVDKKNTKEILEKIKKVHEDREFRENLIEKAKKRSAVFALSHTRELFTRFLNI